jgi:hypothetical protein
MYPRKSFAPLLCLLLASSASAEPPKLSITGPSSVTAGSAVFMQLETDAVAIDWLVFPPNANAVPLCLYQGMTPDGKPILRWALFFSSPTPGTYTFAAVGTKQDQLGKAIHTLVNGKAGPEPNPDPGPNPDPTPEPIPGKRFVLVVRESAQQTPAMAETLMGLRAYLLLQSDTYRFEDPDLKDSTGKTPPWLASYLAKIQAAKVALPVMVVAEPDGGGNKVIAIVPLPNSSDEAIAAVKKAGG